MAANNLLNQNVPVYHRFVDNQVLTDDQLNQVIDHINYQDKLTRTKLIGVGIVCGLQISASSTQIRLSKGVAVTTDGDILKVDDTIFRGYKPFLDEQVNYAHFLNGEKTIPLYELESDLGPSDVLPLSKFSSDTEIAADRQVALLYLENYLKEEKDCSPVDCNAQGREVVNRIRVLLTSIEHAKTIVAKDSIFSGLLPNTQKDVLNKIDSYLPKRVVVNSVTGATYTNLKDSFAVNFNGLANRLGQLSALSIFSDLEPNVNLKIKDSLSKLSSGELTFQYLYDFYKDLATAYNDLLKKVRENYAICCPNPLAFPKHVMLGEVSFSPVYLRHRFYASPIHDQQGTIDLLRKMFTRIVQMIKHFSPRISKDVRVTPSRKNSYQLGKRALPYYYHLNKFERPEALLHVWDVQDQELPLNYDKAGYPSAQFDPNDYCLDDHGLFRIEGHVGLEVNEAVKTIQEIRNTKGLPFDVVPIAIGNIADEATLDYDKYNMYFEDLQVILRAWNEEQKCMVAGTTKFFTGFSLANKGKHVAYTHEQLVEADVLHMSNASALASDALMAKATNKLSANYTMNKVVSANRKNQVLDNIEVKEDSVGHLYKDAWKTSDGSSDIELKAKNAILEKVTDWEKEYKVAVMEIPTKLLGKLKVTEDNTLFKIEDFTEENLEKYITSLQAQCAAAKQAKKDLQAQLHKENSQLSGQAYIENYFFVLNRIISSCCLVEKVRVLFQTIIDRKQDLLGKMVLKEYAKSHPSAEHTAGVEKGGTFVILYYSTLREKLTSTTPKAELQLTAKAIEKAKESEALLRNVELMMKVNEPDTRSLSNLAALRETRDDDAIKKLKELIAERGKSFASKQSNLAHGVVIGDLCLPYICCTDTPATTFVFPNEEVRLFISKDHACVPFETEAEHVAIEVSPIDGEVTAFVDDTELKGVIIKNESNFFFDPNKVPEQLFGNPIKFKVNGQNTTETFTVHRKPAASFTVSDKIEFRNENSQAVITLRNTSAQLNGQQFNWSFGDGTKKEIDAIEFTYSYQVKPGSNYDFEINMVASNASCTDDSKQTISIDVPANDDDGGRTCQDVTFEEIVGAQTEIEKEIEQHPDDLREQALFYARTMRPVFTLILKDKEKSLNGDFDTKLFEMIESVQHGIDERLTVNNVQEEQKFLLRLYFVNLLLYFYVQRCRDTTISLRRGREISSQWVEFTANAGDTFIEALLDLNNEFPLKDEIDAVRNSLDSRLSGSLKTILNKVLELLKAAIERN